MTGVLRAVIIGAGPAGLAAAAALHRADVEAVVYERGTALSSEGGGLTLWPNGLAALAAFDMADVVYERSLASPGTSMRGSDGRLLTETSGPELDRIGGRGIALHRAELLSALAGGLPHDAIRFGRQCVAVRDSPDGATALFTDAADERADLLVGADGIRSRIRRDCVSDGPLRYGGFVVWRATIKFLLPTTPGSLSFGGPHQFGIWRLPDDRVYWFASAPMAEVALPLAPRRPPQVFQRWHEPIPALIEATATSQMGVSAAYDCAPLAAWHAGRVVLVGDAAHPMLPNMGQGASQAFEDAAVLADELRSCPDVNTALRHYHRRRRRRARSAWSQARLLARVGVWRSPCACQLRETMIAAAPRRAQIRQLERLFAFDAHLRS